MIFGCAVEIDGMRHFLFVLLLGVAAIVVQPGNTGAAEEIPGVFNAPPVGTTAEYALSDGENFKIVVIEVNGKEVLLEGLKSDEAFKNRPNSRGYGLLVPMRVRGATQFDRRRIDRFFPLAVGKKIRFTYEIGNRQRRRTVTVLRTELARVPAGDFFTYVMMRAETGVSGGSVIERVSWYSPEVGLLVKTETRIRGGTRSGETSIVELTNIIDPDGNQLYPVPEPEPQVAAVAEQPAIKPTAADGQKLFDAGDYAGAVNVWFSAAQVGDALAMLKLGELHEDGLGVPQSFLRAHLFYNLAAAKGDARAREARNLIAAKMTAGTLAEAQELAEGWPESAKRLAK